MWMNMKQSTSYRPLLYSCCLGPASLGLAWGSNGIEGSAESHFGIKSSLELEPQLAWNSVEAWMQLMADLNAVQFPTITRIRWWCCWVQNLPEKSSKRLWKWCLLSVLRAHVQRTWSVSIYKPWSITNTRFMSKTWVTVAVQKSFRWMVGHDGCYSLTRATTDFNYCIS